MKSLIVRFYWGHHAEESFMMEIDADETTIENLLDEYRESDLEEYNNDDWLKFLKKKGIKARSLDSELEMYF